MFSTGPFERCERSEKAFVSPLMRMHVCGVSIWKVAKVTEGLCGHRFSASTVSRIDAKLDAGLKQFAERSPEGPFPYLILDARYEKVRSVSSAAKPMSAPACSCACSPATPNGT